MTLRTAIGEAEALRRAGNFEAARRCLEAALREARSAHRDIAATTSDELFLAENIASLALMSGDASLADLFLDAAAAARDAAGEWWRGDFATLQRIHIALTANAIDKARELFRQTHGIGPLSTVPDSDAASARWEESRPWPRNADGWRERLFTSAYLEMARLYTATGECEKAVRLAERGFRFATAEGAPPPLRESRIPLQIAAAEARVVQGHLVDARERLGGIGTIDVARFPAWRAQWLALSTRAAWLEGNLGRALELATEHLGFCESLRLDHAVAHARLNLAELRMQLNEHAAARQLLDAVAGSTAPVRWPEIAARLSSLATICAEQRTIYFDGPRSVLEQKENRSPLNAAAAARPATRRRRNWNLSHAETVDEFMIELHAAAGRGWFIASKLKQLAAEGDSPLMAARIAFGRGLHAYAGRRFEAAECCLSKARQHLLSLDVPTELYECQRWLAWSWRRLGRAESDWRALRRENAALLERIAATLKIDDRAAFFLNKWSEEEEDLAEELKFIDAEQRSLLGRIAPPRRLRLMARCSRLIDRLLALRDAFARTVVAGEKRTEGPVRSTPLWRRLLVPPRQATLVFVVLPNAVTVFTMILGRLTVNILPTSRQTIRDKVAQCHADWSDDGVAKLAEIIGLQAAIEALPRWIKRLEILADDVLHGVPFAALQFDDRELIHRFAITMAHSLVQPSARPRAAKPAAVFAGISRGQEGQAPLENAPQLQIVRDAIRPSVLRELDDATCSVSALTGAMAGANVVHITCHGIFDPESPHQTGLVLPDGMLTLRDLSRQQFPSLHVAMLVSCWSADAYVRPGRWVVSAPEVLCRAGAESVIAALWEVDNERVAPFLAKLYENLKTMRRDEALRHAQIDATDSLLPYVWASFQLHGRRERLRWKGFR